MGIRLHTRIGLVFIASLVTLLLVLLTMFWGFHTARLTQGLITETYRPAADASRQMIAEANRMFTAELIYPLDLANRDAIETRFTTHRAEFERHLAEVRRLADLPEEARLLRLLEEEDRAFMANHRRVVALVDQGQVAEARRVQFTQQGPHVGALLGAADAVFDLNRARVEELNALSMRRFDQAEALSLGIALIGLLVAAGLWWLTSRDLVAPLRSLMVAGASLSRGQFVQVRHPHAPHTLELKALEDSFNAMSERLERGKEDLERQVAERTLDLATANQRLQALVEELETLDQLKSNFLAVMSHELLTPINFITGFGSALEDEVMGPLNDKQRDTVGKMLAGAERLTRMVRNTLEYTQLETGTLQVYLEEVGLPDVVEALEATVAPTLAAREQKLEVELPEDLPALQADPDRLRQVLFELLDNASKFSPEGAKVELSASADPDFVSIAVRDTGEGIPESAIADLVRPFYQADFTVTRAHGGMGLGLAIAHHLVARMQGTLLIHSKPGEGTVVRVLLPRYQAAGPSSASRDKFALSEDLG